MTSNVTAANTPAAQAAFDAFQARQADRRALEACSGDLYECPCAECMAACEAETAAEIRAESAWLRAAENDGHGYVQGCPCC